jgi:hypothetical protein
MGAGPIQNMQIRYVIANTSGVSPITPSYVVSDPTCAGNSSVNGTQDDPSKWEMINYITAFQCQVPPMLREVRVQLVSVATVPDKATDARVIQTGYTTPTFEGVSPVQALGKPTFDPYPRRAFTTRVTPRSLQGGRQ